jgi:plasmid stabilization system protein ParE
MASEAERIVDYSEEATSDLAEIYNYTTLQRGTAQAERYLAFLSRTALQAAEGGLVGRPISDFEGLWAVKAKWPSARHGHLIIFRREPYGIHVLRVLHTAMDIRSRLGGP